METNWRYAVVGNIIGEHIGDDGNTYYGTKAFKPNTKVYIAGKEWWKSHKPETVEVIGINRYRKYVRENVDIRHIENIRMKKVYKTTPLKIMDYVENFDGDFAWWGSTEEDKADAQGFVDNWNLFAKKENGENIQ